MLLGVSSTSGFKNTPGSGIVENVMVTQLSNRLSRLLLTVLSSLLLGPTHASEASIQWRSLSAVQHVLGTTNFVWDGDSLSVSNAHDSLRFYQGRRKSDINGTTVWLNMETDGSIMEGAWRIAGVDLDFLQLAVLPRQEGAVRPLRVMLDPGHGGDDEGARSKDPLIKEKDLTLTLAKKIGAQLKKAGIHVDYTRTRDTTLSLSDRSRIARTKKADIFISIHANYAENRDACGVETYVLPPSGFPGTANGSRSRGWQIGNRNDFQNTLLGFSLHQRLASRATAVDRGLKRQSFFVLRETVCPAVLLEFGFLSNREESLQMLDQAWQEENTRAVVDGILTYARKIDGLDKAVAEKRARDAEANERWRQHLAARSRQAASDAALTVNRPNTVTKGLPAPSGVSDGLSSPIPGREPEPPPYPCISNMVASSASAEGGVTNAVPAIHTLMNFYGTGKVQ